MNFNHLLVFIATILMLLACGGGGSGSTSNNYNSGNSLDDYGDNLNQATGISLNVDNYGSIENAGDIDFFQIYVPSKGTLSIYSTGSTNVFGYLYDASGNKLFENDDAGGIYGNNFYMQGVVATESRYYIGVKHSTQTGTGSYILRADFSPTTTTTTTTNVDCAALKKQLADWQRSLSLYESAPGYVPPGSLAVQSTRYQVNELTRQININCR